MWHSSMLASWRSTFSRTRRGQRPSGPPHRQSPRTRLTIEALEDRTVPSGFGHDVVPGDPNDWPMFGHDPAGTRYNQAEHQLRADNVADLEIKWTYPTTGFVVGTPAVVNDRVYAAADDG